MALPARTPRAPAERPGSAAGRYERAARGAVLARRRLDQGIEVLGRLVPLALRISRGVGAYVAVVAAALVFAPVAMLWLFHRALAEVVQIPARLAAVPDVARDHGGELARLVRDAQVGRGRFRLTSLPADLWRAGRLLLAAHDDLPGYGAVLTLVSVPFLLASLAAACVGLVLIVTAPAVLVGGVLTAVV